jgi:hypothetical protein
MSAWIILAGQLKPKPTLEQVSPDERSSSAGYAALEQ